MVHALAQRVATGELRPGPADVDQLMGHVEKVWDRLEFRTPWAKARELDRIRTALSRFLAWHHANARTLVGVETGFRAVLELPNGESVRLDGYADRIELDAAGRVVVVDLKTGRAKPSDKSVLTNVQLGLYQLAVDHGAADELLDGRARAGGAELVQLGLTGDAETATVQRQPDQADDGPERAALRDRLERAAAFLRAESFPAVAGNHCRDCGFVPLCPVKGRGSVIGP
jgi:RecB family exonuclease